ncbi:hypothetical protein AMTRI_Chr11g158220 [Amborella trichopoda]
MASLQLSPAPRLYPSSFSSKTHLKTSLCYKTQFSVMPKTTQVSCSYSPENSSPVILSVDSSTESSSPKLCCEVVKGFYSGINRHNLGYVSELIAENCVYEDLVFSEPFVGRKAILEFFKKFTDSITTDLQFVIDDISDEDSSAVGVKWHLEWQGKEFPFSKGCSFYRSEVFNGKRQIVYGRDSVEPAIKPGETALVAIKGVTWLLKQFPQLADRL